jgi:hypothetical protein
MTHCHDITQIVLIIMWSAINSIGIWFIISPPGTVGTHKDCTYFDNVPKVFVPTIKVKDTGTVSLGATAGREPGGRRAAYPCSPTKVRRSYASMLKG